MMTEHRIRCAHCKSTHPTVAEVRQCSRGNVPAPRMAAPPRPWDPFSGPKKVEQAHRQQPVTEAGMYRDPNTKTVYKVQKAVHGSGRLYAKVLTDCTELGTWTFEMAPGMIRKLDARWKMTLEQAQEFGKLYGVCVRCGATLTDEGSIAAGIGPVCATKF